ncbi:MAG: hypothetical protein HWQ38_02860 [Nostoc sp. NMS7]|uniref:hypothetical protein n=1 Tax=Nostoc sp. NMS7 TaxID=2815391 RepID=UPI0025F78E65|nr:hypothetical protein [Nostoc sp. NMS7]MBN3945476.1 hypothetical protein [Nostoc sp. NMS7]
MVLSLIEKYHTLGYPIKCVPVSGCRRHRLACGYYRIFLHGEDSGDWSELEILGVLSLLQQEFYRGRRQPKLGAMSG